MLYRSPENPNSHLTLKDRSGPSFPTKQLWYQKRIRGRVLDFGCGDGVDVDFLQKQGVDAAGFDPHYAPQEPAGKFDTIICQYVLNVLLPEEQSYVLMAVSELLQPGGRAYFAVRRDIRRSGYRTHLVHNVRTYQCQVVLPYPSILKTEHCEIYEYRHFNQVTHSGETGCPFCSPSLQAELLTESATAYAMVDQTSPSQIRVEIIPKQHIGDYFNLPARAKTACWMMLERVRSLLLARYSIESYQVEIQARNSNYVTRQHAHITLAINQRINA